MPTRSSTRGRDINQLAKHIVEIATGQAEDKLPNRPEKNAAAVALGRLGGKKGGAARAQLLSAERRSEIATAAARARWMKRQDQDDG
jgi:hypothetical protein